MQFTLASTYLLLASLASAQSMTSSPSASVTPTPSSSYYYSYSTPSFSFPSESVLASRISAIPSKSWSSIAAAGTSQAASEVSTKYFDCVYENYGCDWVRSNLTSATTCGSSPYKAGHELSDGSVILAVSKDGSGDCASQAGSQCCKLLANEPCKSGEKYLECHQA